MSSIKEFACSLSRETRCHGSHDENSKQLFLKAGKLSVMFENGNLRGISMGGVEIIRMIYSAVRDRSWITIKPVISDEKMEINPDSFELKYTAFYSSGDIAFRAKYAISGTAENSLIVSLSGEALNDFEKNRIGFCVLHPVEGTKGEKCTIVHSNGIAEEKIFPYYIAPHQPFLEIKSMNWRISGLDCSLDFYGDVFEMEDQRNWTDASYKTYCTPLSHPKPARVLKGQKISQAIVLSVTAENIEELSHIEKLSKEDQVTIAVDRGNTLPFPKLGIGRSTRINSLTENEAVILRKIGFDHYRIDLLLFNNDWRSIADIGFNEAEMLGLKVETALFLDDDWNKQVELFIEFIENKNLCPSIIIPYHEKSAVLPDEIADVIAQNLKKAIPGVKVCCGTNANFAQLNRKKPQSRYSDFMSYAIHPQEHASDNNTLVENLKGQEYTVESAKQFSQHCGIWISPLNIQRRFNANVSIHELPSESDSFPPQADSRLMSLFGAGWITGSLKYLIESGVAGITLLETVGERGIIQGDYNSRWPEDFQSAKGMIFPVYFVLKYILSCKKYSVLRSKSSDPLKVESFVMSEEKKLKIILVNFTDSVQRITIDAIRGYGKTRELNSETYCFAAADYEWLEEAEGKDKYGKKFLEPFSVTFVEAENN